MHADGKLLLSDGGVSKLLTVACVANCEDYAPSLTPPPARAAHPTAAGAADPLTV